VQLSTLILAANYVLRRAFSAAAEQRNLLFSLSTFAKKTLSTSQKCNHQNARWRPIRQGRSQATGTG